MSMSAEADKLRADIAAAEQRLDELESRADVPHAQRVQMRCQIERVKGLLRDMKIKLASLAAPTEHRDNACPHCGGMKTHSFLVCIACWRDVPFKIWAYFKGAEGLHHRGKVSNGYLKAAREKVFSHLRQHSTAV